VTLIIELVDLKQQYKYECKKLHLQGSPNIICSLKCVELNVCKLIFFVSYIVKFIDVDLLKCSKGRGSVFFKCVDSHNLLVRAMFVNTNCSFLESWPACQ
jgi:hypothetical protein